MSQYTNILKVPLAGENTTTGFNESTGGLLALDVKLVSWPGITLEVSDNFYAIFWIFLILALILMTFSVAISGILSVVLIVTTVKNWSFVKTLVFEPPKALTGDGGMNLKRMVGNRPRGELGAGSGNEIINGMGATSLDDADAPGAPIINPSYEG